MTLKVGSLLDLKYAKGHFVLKVSSFKELENWYMRAKEDLTTKGTSENRETLKRLIDHTFQYYSLTFQDKN